MRGGGLRRREMFASKRYVRWRYRGTVNETQLLKEILIPGSSKPVGLRRALRKKLKIQGHSKMITCIGVSTGGTLLASGSLDLTVRLWSLDDSLLMTDPFGSANHWCSSILIGLQEACSKFVEGEVPRSVGCPITELDIRIGKQAPGTPLTYVPVSYWTNI